ncbi:MAG: DUF362 domain-containing protein, partial [Candidatus Hodarchaeales archaeon]
VKHPENCTACGKCIEVCPPGCLSLEDGIIVLDSDRCVSCVHCFDVCNADKPKLEQRVFRLKRQLKSDEQVERMMDNAAGTTKLLGPDRIRYLNVAVDITSHCDCVPAGGHPLVPDQGILCSEDPVAIDQACRDLVAKAKGLPGSPAETGVDVGRGVQIEPDLAALEPNSEKLGLFSAFVPAELRSEIVEIQLSAAEALGIGKRSYELIEVKKELKEEA